MRKAQTTLLLVGISILIFIILLVSTASWASNLVSGVFGASTLERNLLVLNESAVEALSSGESRFLLDLPSNSAIIIMNPRSGFEFELSEGDITEKYSARGYRMTRPLECESDKTCICACSRISFRPGSDTANDAYISCADLICKSADFKVESRISNVGILNNVETSNVWGGDRTSFAGAGYWLDSFILLKESDIGFTYYQTGLLRYYSTAGYQGIERYQEQDIYEFRVEHVGSDVVRFCLYDDCDSGSIPGGGAGGGAN